jgi:hypothetical protein
MFLGIRESAIKTKVPIQLIYVRKLKLALHYQIIMKRYNLTCIDQGAKVVFLFQISAEKILDVHFLSINEFYNLSENKYTMPGGRQIRNEDGLVRHKNTILCDSSIICMLQLKAYNSIIMPDHKTA